VLGRAPGERSGPPLTGAAARNLAAFRTVYRRRDYDEAERLLDEVTVSLNGIGRPSAWADRRRRLARRAAREGRPERGYRIAAQHYLTPADGYAYADCEWIAGWIALRRLNDPARALPHFERFEAAVETPISLGRAGYWLGRTHTALGNAEAARRAYAGAAQHQTSFYGQLAAAEIGAPGDTRLAGRDLPDWRNSPGLRQDDVRMAVLLHLAGRDSLALQSFAHLGKTLDGVGQVAALGALLIDLGKPHYAVRMAKQAARRGIVLHPVYYPLHDLAEYASAVEPAFALSIARQETELNPVAVSPAGARGLMQLMPGTARKVASWIGEPYDRGRLTRDWRYNARLGQTYLARRTAQFGGSYVMAAAAYNAGAGRVDQWVGEYGDPRLPGVDLIDWMENIPFRETRNYVQRVMEGLYIYRTRLSGTAGPMTIQADLARGVRG
ncbi:MAG: lytic transglycosylase domain-containing protein, partial [Pseudomonadota bacterium]